MHLFDQERLLDESITCVKQCALQMERCLDKGDLVGAIHHCADMLREMRTSALSPKSYYELYIVVTEKLRLLESTLIEEHKSGKKLSNLYETIQYVANIIPRLYLLITVGVYHIKCAELSRREIIRDLVEMCSGVQHPVRGLFLRSYLLHALRTELLPVNEDPEPKQDLKTEDANTSDVTATSPDPEKKSADMSSASAHADSQGTISDSIRFLLLNFSEMNKLWVRMQHQGHSRDRERREQERRELRLLVGTNLNRLSQLEGIDVIRYQTQVLPPIIEQLIVCRDVIAQEYLMDVIIQVFPDEFHLSTLRTLLATCNQLQPGVRLRQIICSLVERLSQFALNELASGRSLIVPEAITTNCAHVPPDQDSAPGKQSVPESEYNLDSETALFTLFFDGLCDLIEARIRLSRMGPETQIPSGRHALINLATLHGLPPEDIPAMFASLVYLAMVLYPKQSPSLVDICLKATADSLEQLGISLVAPASPLSKELLNLLHLPLGGSPFHMSTNTGHSGNALSGAPFEAMGELRTVLGMSGFRRLVTLLDPKTTKCRLACNLLAGTLERDQRQRQVKKTLHTQTPTSNGIHEVLSDNSCRLTSEADLDGLFDLISGLLSPSSNIFDDPDEFAEVQSLIAGVLHLIGPIPRTDDPGLCYNLFCKAQSTLAQAGPRIIRFNFPALIFEGLQLIQAYSELEDKQGDWDDAVHKVVSFVHRCITCLVATDAPEIALRLFLQASLVIDRVEFSKRESMTYEFVSQALTLYEEGVSEARAQIDSMSLITSTLCQLRCFTDDNRNTLRTQCSRAAAHLLRKHDQSRAVAASAHLYWPLPILMRQNVKPSVMVSLTEKPVKTETVRECLEQLSESDLKVLRDGTAALACLDRAARLAQDCMDTTVKAQLFMNILNHAISLRLQNCLEVTDDRINKLIETVKALIDELNPTTAAAEEIVRHLENTISFVHHCQTVPDPSNPPADHVTELFSSVNLF